MGYKGSQGGQCACHAFALYEDRFHSAHLDLAVHVQLSVSTESANSLSIMAEHSSFSPPIWESMPQHWTTYFQQTCTCSILEGVLAKYWSHQSDNRLVFASPQPIRVYLSSYRNVGFFFCCYSPPFTGHTIYTRKVQLCMQRHNSDKTPLLMHWNYVFLALTHWFVFVHTKYTVMWIQGIQDSWIIIFDIKFQLPPQYVTGQYLWGATTK